MRAQHQPGGVQAVEAAAQLGIDEAAQGGRVLAELGAALLQGGEDAAAVGDHLLAGTGGSLLGLGGQRRHRQQGRRDGDRQGQDQGLHGVVSVGDGELVLLASAGADAPPPPNMYLPASWIRSTAGWV